MSEAKNRKVLVCDFDETLCISDEQTIRITHQDGSTTNLPGSLWADYHPKQGDLFDFSDCQVLKNPEPNFLVWDKYLSHIQEHGKEHVWVCTARAEPDPIRDWLGSMEIETPQVACMAIPPGENNGVHKARFIRGLIETHGYSQVEFYDDRQDCVQEVLKLKVSYPHVGFLVGQALKGGEINTWIV